LLSNSRKSALVNRAFIILANILRLPIARRKSSVPAAYDVDSLHAAGLDKLQCGEFRAAADILEFAVEAGPAYAGAHAALGIALHHLGRSTRRSPVSGARMLRGSERGFC
jgi:hypothetical protein